MTSASAAPRSLVTQVRTAAAAEVAALGGIPGGPWPVLAAAAVLGVAFAVPSLGYTTLWSESLPLILVALALGVVGRAPGMVFTVAFGLIDLALAPGRLTDQSPEVLFGRFGTLVVLGTLVVALPSLARIAESWLLARLRVRGSALSAPRIAAAAVAAALLGFLALGWTEAAYLFVRGAFVDNTPIDTAVAVFDAQWPLVVAAAVVFALVRSLALRPRLAVDADLLPLLPNPAAGTPAWIALTAVRTVVSLAMLRGIISGPVDLVVLLAALIGAPVLVLGLGRSSAGTALQSVPFGARLIAAFVVMFGVALVLFRLPAEPMLGSSSLPVIAAVAIGTLVFAVLAGLPPRADATPSGAGFPAVPRGAAAALGILAFGTLVLARPAPVAAKCHIVITVNVAYVAPHPATRAEADGLADCAADAGSWAFGAAFGGPAAQMAGFMAAMAQGAMATVGSMVGGFMMSNGALIAGGEAVASAFGIGGSQDAPGSYPPPYPDAPADPPSYPAPPPPPYDAPDAPGTYPAPPPNSY